MDRRARRPLPGRAAGGRGRALGRGQPRRSRSSSTADRSGLSSSTSARTNSTSGPPSGDRGGRDTDLVTAGAGTLLRGLRVPRPLVVRTEHTEVTVGPDGSAGEPVVLATTTFEAFRWRLGRRSRRQLAAMDWSGDPEPFLDSLCVFGPAEVDSSSSRPGGRGETVDARIPRARTSRRHRSGPRGSSRWPTTRGQRRRAPSPVLLRRSTGHGRRSRSRPRCWAVYLYRQHARRTLPEPSTIVDIELDGGAAVDRRALAALAPPSVGHLLWDLPLIALYGLGPGPGRRCWLLVGVAARRRAAARPGSACSPRRRHGRSPTWSRTARCGGPSAERGAGLLRRPAPSTWRRSSAVIKFSASVPAAVVLLVGVRADRRPASWPVGLLARRRARAVARHRAPARRAARAARTTPVPGASAGALPATADGGRAGPVAARLQRAGVRPSASRARTGSRPGSACPAAGSARPASPWARCRRPSSATRVVPAAQYLVSVSGGGYTAGAFQQALTGAGAAGGGREGRAGRELAGDGLPARHARRRTTSAGTPATSPRTWSRLLVALGLLARHLLLTLVLLFGPAVLLGVTAGAFYRSVAGHGARSGGNGRSGRQGPAPLLSRPPAPAPGGRWACSRPWRWAPG